MGNFSSLVQHSVIVTGPPEYIERKIDNYLLYCVGEGMVGCWEIVQYADGSAAEIDSLAIDISYRNQGIVSELVREAVKEIIPGGFRLVFAFSTTVYHIFSQCGFEQKSP